MQSNGNRYLIRRKQDVVKVKIVLPWSFSVTVFLDYIACNFFQISCQLITMGQFAHWRINLVTSGCFNGIITINTVDARTGQSTKLQTASLVAVIVWRRGTTNLYTLLLLFYNTIQIFCMGSHLFHFRKEPNIQQRFWLTAAYLSVWF